MSTTIKISTAWDSMSTYLYVPHTEDEYDRLVLLLDQLTNEVGEDEHHQLASLMEIIGALIELYEAENVRELA